MSCPSSSNQVASSARVLARNTEFVPPTVVESRPVQCPLLLLAISAAPSASITSPVNSCLHKAHILSANLYTKPSGIKHQLVAKSKKKTSDILTGCKECLLGTIRVPTQQAHRTLSSSGVAIFIAVATRCRTVCVECHLPQL